MNATMLKRLRPASLALFVAGVAAVIAAMETGNHSAFLAAGLVTFGGLGFFAFTEAFLFPPPERAPFDVWLARVFFLLNALAVFSLAHQLAESLL